MANFNLNDYETVSERLRRFKADWPDSVILTELVENVGPVGGTRWTMKASIWRERSPEAPDATGWAFEVDGMGMANKTSALENCETSAIGRALANLNYHGDKRATREEMEKVRRSEEAQAAEEEARRVWVAQQQQKLLDFEKDGDMEKLVAMRDWYAAKGYSDLTVQAGQIIDRMAKNNVEEVVEAEPLPM